MNAYNIQFRDTCEIRQFPNICFLELSEEFRRDSKMSLNEPW